MESLKILPEKIKRHYEKILLTLVLLVLGATVWYLFKEGQKEKQTIKNFMVTEVEGTEKKPFKEVDLIPFEDGRAKLSNPPKPVFGLPHNLLNSVKWQKRPDGTMIKIDRADIIGPRALKVDDIRELALSISVSRPAGSGFWMIMTNELVDRRLRGHRVQQFVSLTRTNTPVFFLSDVRPKENPTEWIVELKDTGEKVSITKEKPFRKVVGYEADLTYSVDQKNFKRMRPKAALRLSGENYNIVAITAREVLLSADSNDRRYAIQYKGVP